MYLDFLRSEGIGMGMLQEMWERHLEDESFLRRMLAKIIFRRLEHLGFTLDEGFLATIESKLSVPDLSGFSLEFEDEQVPPGLLKEGAMAGTRDAGLELGNLSQELDQVVAQFTADMTESVPHIVHDISPVILGTLRRRAARMLRGRSKGRKSFESGMAKTWRRSLDLLEMLVVICLEAGEEFNREWRQGEPGDEGHVLEVLTRLHARACQVASEILVLLRAGYADGAHARWRCLHEIAVVGFFVASEGDEVAERYLLHDAVECHNAAVQYAEYSPALGLESLTPEELSEMAAGRDELVKRFGPGYGSDYGWAAKAIGKKRPTFTDIEKRVELDHLRPYYKLASHNVHANARGVFFRLGLMPGEGDVLLAGPSNIGLADPGHQCALSLSQITVALLTAQPNLDRLVVCDIVQTVEREVGDAFMEVHNKMEESI